MRTQKDRHHAQKRKKLWDTFDWRYASVNALSKNHSLKCGCKYCILSTYHKRLANKRNRQLAKVALAIDDGRIYEVNRAVKRAIDF